MRIKVNLVIAASNLETGDIYIMLDGQDCPAEYLRLGQQPIDLAYNILQSCIDTDPEWLRFSLIDVYSIGETLNIDYVVVTPKDLQLKSGQWTLFIKVMNEVVAETKKRIQEAVIRI